MADTWSAHCDNSCPLDISTNVADSSLPLSVFYTMYSVGIFCSAFLKPGQAIQLQAGATLKFKERSYTGSILH